MRWNFIALPIMLSVMVVWSSCTETGEVPPPTIPKVDKGIRMDWEAIPHDSLSSYGFFVGDLKNMEPTHGVLPFSPINRLFTDFVHKKRYVWMPPSVSAEYVSDGETLHFPDSAMLIKHFYYEDVQPAGERKILETRIMYMMSGVWHFANYVWNDEQTEATYDMQGQTVHVEWLEPEMDMMQVDYRIPGESECFTCHKNNDSALPLGTKPQSLNSLYDYGEGLKNQLAKWEEVGYLAPGYPAHIETLVDWKDPTAGLTERVRSFFDMNCGSCHSEGGHCAYRSLRLDYASTTEAENMGVCVEPDEYIIGQSHLTYLIAAGYPEKSALLYRMESTAEEERMPLLGRTLTDPVSVDLITQYIESLEVDCE